MDTRVVGVSVQHPIQKLRKKWVSRNIIKNAEIILYTGPWICNGIYCVTVLFIYHTNKLGSIMSWSGKFSMEVT